MRYIGAHVSTSGGLFHGPENAQAIGANAMAIFLKNQRQWQSAPYTAAQIDAFRKKLDQSGISPEHVLPHDSYLINIGSPDGEMREKSVKALTDEAFRAHQLGLRMVNFHPGSHLNKISEEECEAFVAQGINSVHNAVPEVVMVIECTAGQGSNIGYKFSQLGQIISQVEDKSRVAVCLDTCHAMAAGYELSDPAGYRVTFEEFDREIGLHYLRAFHLNDSKNGVGSHKDRHESLGRGYLGLEAFKNIMTDERFKEAVFILETPNPDIWAEEIALLRQMASA